MKHTYGGRMELDLNNKQKQILWSILNNAQAQGMHHIGKLLEQLKATEVKQPKIFTDWLHQTIEEYDFINMLKAKLQEDKE